MTWYQYYNYGTALQAVALYYTIKSMGYDAHGINYKSCLSEDSLPSDSLIKFYTNKASTVKLIYKKIWKK